MLAIHQHFRLNHRHDAYFLAECGVTGECVAVGFNAGAGRNIVADADHRAPFGKTGAELRVFLQAITQAIKTFRADFTRKTSQRLRPFVDLDPGNDAVLAHHFRERHAIAGFLAQGFVVQDCAGNVVAQLRRGQQQLAIAATIFFRALDADTVETFLDRIVGLINGDNALARSHHGLGSFGE